MNDVRWVLDMEAKPVVPAWTTHAECHTNGAELQRAIIKGFSENGDPIWGQDKELTFEKTFNFKEHGEFFRGALTMAGLRYTNDFYELLKRYETIKVSITKKKEERGKS